MVHFNELKFSDDVKTLILDLALEDTDSGEENEGCFISAIYLEYYKNRNVTGSPSDKALKIFEAEGETTTTVTLEVPVANLDYNTNGVAEFSEGLFYVIVTCKKDEVGDSDPDDYTVTNEFGAVLDWNYVYATGMKAVVSYIVRGKHNCNVPADLEQFAILWHSLDLSIEAQDLDMLDVLWSRFSGSVLSSKDCNCS